MLGGNRGQITIDQIRAAEGRRQKCGRPAFEILMLEIANFSGGHKVMHILAIIFHVIIEPVLFNQQDIQILEIISSLEVYFTHLAGEILLQKGQQGIFGLKIMAPDTDAQIG